MTKKNTTVEYFWIPARVDEHGKTRAFGLPAPSIPMDRMPVSVATCMTSYDPNVKPNIQDSEMQHLHTVFYEDKGHDWNWKGGVFRYYSRAMDGSCWIRCVFKD